MQMPYFAEHHHELRWRDADRDPEGLRPPQLAALHAIGAHFLTRHDPAIVTMPTGSGKTAVLMATPFLLRSGRVLVLTPGRLVRGQIAAGFRELSLLKQKGILPDVAAPKVYEAAKRIITPSDWESLQDFDVVIGTPASLSPAIEGIPEPPADLFQAVLVDEAHHSPAATWQSLLDHFPKAARVLFTATPFRRDKRELTGAFVYTYEMSQALREGVFGRITYVPITPGQSDGDLAIAQSAWKRLRADQASGYEHRMLVRAGTVHRARNLLKLYESETDLRLTVITGNSSVRTLRTAIARLESGDLDGIVCVDMFGEGFDFPNLKVAALHSPHRSLAVTLQFIGRFARTAGAGRLGPATFFALASEMEVERARLYADGAAWEGMIPELSAERIAHEVTIRRSLETFQGGTALESEHEDVSLFSLQPQFHVKILESSGDISVLTPVEFAGAITTNAWVSQDENAAIYVTKSTSRPRWTTSDRFDAIAYDLTIVHYNSEAKLLFIGTTVRTPGFYRSISEVLAGVNAIELKPVFFGRLNKVLLDLDDARFYNVGMRQTGAATNESYRTLTGRRADGSIRASDARSFARGHLAGTGSEDGTPITIGLSGASKVWSAASGSLPEFLGWCRKLALKIRDRRDPHTLSGIDWLMTGVELNAIPPDVAFVDWAPDAYADTMLSVKCADATGRVVRLPLLELELSIDRAASGTDGVSLAIETPIGRITALFRYGRERLIEVIDSELAVTVECSGGDASLADYLNEHLPVLRTIDFSRIDGYELIPSVFPDVPFDLSRCEVVSWTDEGVDMTIECGDKDGKSIHAYLTRTLSLGGADVVMYDHGPGEIADFLEVSVKGSAVHATLYHAKASGAAAAGARVEDAYEVCGQAIKSANWHDRRRLLNAVKRRLKRASGGSYFLVGDINILEGLLTPSAEVTAFVLDVVIVQPGFSKCKIHQSLGPLLAAVDEYLRACGKLTVLTSA